MILGTVRGAQNARFWAWRVLAACARGPVIRVVGQYDTIGAQLIDQPGRISRAGYPRCTVDPTARTGGGSSPWV
jgi:hypothetical protein